MTTKRSTALTPKQYVLLVLLSLTLIGMFDFRDIQGQFLNVVVAVVTGAVLDLAVGLYQKRKQLLPDGALVTSLIIALVLGAATPWYSCAIVTVIALLSKHLLKQKRRPLFNPAAFGLVAANVFFSSMQSWWGGLAMLPAWCVVFVLIGGFLVTDRVNKFPQVFSFLGIYFLVLLIMGLLHLSTAADALRPPFLNSTLFLSFFMLTDPPTSPAKYKDQIIFGAIAAVVSALVYVIFGWLGYLLVGLLAANAWQFLNAKRSAVSIR